ncbi:uncharacterized protein LY89DRAFT_677562 [Mollisia scopiformis]|uniref:Uncharacterized protein n=1 Tax=Mollisia scopiformis TaxID=149040 RepID=A0A132B5U8_MOLSC|nr:uncharacterized protein LY89DRAFT_677562 [Mollisia scopiformis]KUJ07780.1 hypothetical protein LY89DRAFT_677562 [Mollisia scopiformis]
MKSSAVILALLSVATASFFAPRADTTSSVDPTTTTYSISPTASCLAACKPGDVNCQAACVGSAHPNSVQVNQTNVCADNCPKGDGSTSANNAYEACLDSCIQSYYPTSQTAAPVSVGSGSVTSVSAGATGTAGQATGSGSATTSTSASGTGSVAATSSSKAAGANNLPYIASAGGFGGLLLAFLAL